MPSLVTMYAGGVKEQQTDRRRFFRGLGRLGLKACERFSAHRTLWSLNATARSTSRHLCSIAARLRVETVVSAVSESQRERMQARKEWSSWSLEVLIDMAKLEWVACFSGGRLPRWV